MKKISIRRCFIRRTDQRGIAISSAETAANVEIFTSALSQCTSLQELVLCDTVLSPSALQAWTSLQSLQSLSLVDVSVASSPATGRELQFISQLTNLTTLVITNSEEQQMGGVFSCFSDLTNLLALGITCIHTDHFAAVLGLRSVTALKVQFCNETAEFDCLRILARMTRVHHVRLKATELVRGTSFGLLAMWHNSDGCVLQLQVTARNEGAAIGAVGEMTSVRHVMIQDVRDPCNIRRLNGLPSYCRLWFTCDVGNELLQQVACLHSLTHIFIEKYSGDASGLLWVKHMPNLKHLEFGSAVNDSILRVLPKKLLKVAD